MNRIDSLMARLVEGEPGPGELDELRQCLTEQPELAACLAGHLALHGLLGPALEGELSRERRVGGIMDAVRDEDGKAFVDGVRRKIRRHRFMIRARWAAAAWVVLAAGFALWGWWSMPVATVVRVESSIRGIFLHTGDKILRGDRLQVASGLLEIDLRGRGRMVIEGPAELQFTGAMRSVLEQGRVLLHVNAKGHGYRLETPEGSVVDLGTEFGVFVDPSSGRVETHVLQGEVKAIPRRGGETILLEKDQALRQVGGHVVRIPADEGSFYGSLPPLHSDRVRMVHWDMTMGNARTVSVRTRGHAERGLELRFAAPSSGIFRHVVEGPFGSAVRFDGEDMYGESDFRGIEGYAPRTVAFWVKVPADFDVEHGFAMVSWGAWSIRDPGGVWQISANPVEADGPVGRLRIGVHGGMAIGSTDLRDDRWHHVAVVLYPASRPDFGQHVLLYLDGGLEPVSRRVLGDIDTNIVDAEHGVWVGRNVTSEKARGHLFRGALDELYIFDAALTQPEIRALMERNEAPQ